MAPARKTKTKAASKTTQSRRRTAATKSKSAASRARATRNGRSRPARKTTVTRAKAATEKTASGATVTCPECGRTFTRAVALGAHRRQAHGVIGTSASSRANGSQRRRNTSPTTAPAAVGRQPRAVAVDHDALLRALFPNGIPANERTIRSVNNWLEEADRLARG
jgi:hypothetical protein